MVVFMVFLALAIQINAAQIDTVKIDTIQVETEDIPKMDYGFTDKGVKYFEHLAKAEFNKYTNNGKWDLLYILLN